MPEIPGKYVWDDDDLTPGKKKEGGLHQNLFDDEGNLKANARFIPDEVRSKREPEPEVVYEPVCIYQDGHERQLTREEQDLATKLGEIAGLVLVGFIKEATPHAMRWWREDAWPAIRARRTARIARKAGESTPNNIVAVDATVVEHPKELATAAQEYRADMTSAEAQVRYLAALVARRFSDEQMKLVASANIVDGEGLEELKQVLAELSPEQVKGIIEAAEAKPELMDDELLTELGKLFGAETRKPEPAPIEKIRHGADRHAHG